MSFYEEAYTKIRTFKPSIKDITIKDYLRSIRKISTLLFNSDKPSIRYFEDFNIIQNFINNDPRVSNLSTKKNLITGVVVLLKSYHQSKNLIEKYTEFHKGLQDKQNETYLDNEKSPKEVKNWIKQEDIQNKMDELENFVRNKQGTVRQYIDKIQQYLLLNLYTKIPPLRNDYALVKVIDTFKDNDTSKDYNYIDKSNKLLVLCKYKTDKFYGTKKIDIPPEIFEIIMRWETVKHSTFDIKHNFLLINTTDLQPMTRNGLTRYLNKIFYPKKVSSTLLRKSYLSEKFPITNTYREMEKCADIMGHSTSMGRKVYTKIL